MSDSTHLIITPPKIKNGEVRFRAHGVVYRGAGHRYRMHRQTEGNTFKVQVIHHQPSRPILEATATSVPDKLFSTKIPPECTSIEILAPTGDVAHTVTL